MERSPIQPEKKAQRTKVIPSGLACPIIARRPRAAGAGRSRVSDADRVVRDVRFWHKADMLNALTNVRFEGNNGHDGGVTRCLLLTQSGHVVLPDF